ncbi:portal protein [Novosphingobium resinovorum]|uniref:Phage tail protein n=1 Tax=Novosphingobium resinovorum TaxID=158500 RepID=A0A1D8A553_9SPHN|nr:portal protein [Novosphingobium resinovorum]AOR77216.1 phage tail protein [Novosphingobium resinovorum]
MEKLREHCDQRLRAMKSVRADYVAEWNDIARFAQPARSRFLGSDQNKGTKRRIRNNKLFDPHGIEAFRTLTNGMTSGLTSASRPWKVLKMANEELNALPGVRTWLAECDKAIDAFLARTNFYGAAKAGYGEMGLFGTEACVMVEHWFHGAVCHSLTAGEYWIALSDALVPDTLARECTMTARQIVQTFKSKTPQLIMDAYKGNRGDETFTYFNLIEPNPSHNPMRIGSKAWRSVYWWDGDAADAIIDVRGYDEQPFWAPRWDVVGGDTYGVSPGMECLPALRELQMQAKRRNEAIDRLVKPEMLAKQGVRLTGQPGNVISVGQAMDQYSAMPAYQMPYQAVDAISQEIEKCRLQIDGLSFADLFNAITNMRGIQPRNMEEIASRNEEKLTQLGPVVERASNEKLQVVIDRTFGIMSRGRLLPPAPDSLAEMPGAEIGVEFVPILAQMQRAVGIGQLERAVGFVGNVAGAKPQVLDNIDEDEITREYFERLGVTGKALRDKNAVDEIRAQRAQQQQMEQAAAMMPAAKDGADAARLLSETRAGGVPVLDTMLGA